MKGILSFNQVVAKSLRLYNIFFVLSISLKHYYRLNNLTLWLVKAHILASYTNYPHKFKQT